MAPFDKAQACFFGIDCGVSPNFSHDFISDVYHDFSPHPNQFEMTTEILPPVSRVGNVS